MERLVPTRHCQDCSACDSRLSGVFAGLESAALARLNRTKLSHRYSRGQSLFHEGTAFRGVYCLRSGLVKVFKEAPHDRQYILHLAGPGNVLGLESLVEGGVHTNSAEMLEDGIACQIQAEDVGAIHRESPAFQRAVLQTLASQLVRSEAERAELAAGDVRERTAVALLSLARHFGEAHGSSVRLSVALTREDLARIVGTTPESLIRQLSEFRRKNLLSTNGRSIVLEDLENLARIARLQDPNLI